LKILILSILTIGISGCAAHPEVAAFCVPDRPTLIPVSVDLVASAEEELIHIVSRNQLTLKNHIKLLEDLAEAYNEQLGVSCED